MVPLISVLMPLKDVPGRLLDRAVAGILSQTEGRFEFLIVDDASGPACRRRQETWAERDGRIRLLASPERGVTRALNFGLLQVRAPFVARMDGDDEAAPTRFAEQLPYLEGNPECVAVGSDLILIDPEGRPLQQVKQPRGHDEIERRMLAGEDGVIGHPAVMLRTAALKQIGGYDADFPHSQDLDLFLRLAEVGDLANLPLPLLRYRLHLKAVSFLHLDSQWRCKREAVRRARARRGLPPLELPAEPPRPLSPGLFHLRWARMAWHGGRLSTSARHLMAALARLPGEEKEWRSFARRAWRGKRAA